MREKRLFDIVIEFIFEIEVKIKRGEKRLFDIVIEFIFEIEVKIKRGLGVDLGGSRLIDCRLTHV